MEDEHFFKIITAVRIYHKISLLRPLFKVPRKFKSKVPFSKHIGNDTSKKKLATLDSKQRKYQPHRAHTDYYYVNDLIEEGDKRWPQIVSTSTYYFNKEEK